MKYYSLLFLLSSGLTLAASPPQLISEMSTIDRDFYLQQLAASTEEVQASTEDNSLAFSLKRLLHESSDTQALGDLSFLSDADKDILSSAILTNIETISLFEPYAEKIKGMLLTGDPDPEQLALLLSESREEEQAYRSAIARKAISNLSPRGEEIVMAALNRKALSLSYKRLDYVKLATALPEAVEEHALTFANNVESALKAAALPLNEQEARRKQLEERLSNDNWGVIVK